MLYSRLLFTAGLIVTVVTDASVPLDDLVRYVGYALVVICAMGRLYTTMFIGGRKNETLIASGPYSIARHPLYLLSLTGIVGVSLITGNPIVIIFLPLGFLIVYQGLMHREEDFLCVRFGAAYTDYMQTTPRLLPKFSLYAAPDLITIKPAFVKNGLMDALVWFLALPVVELISWTKAL